MLKRVCASLGTVLLGSMLFASVGATPAFADCQSTAAAARLTLSNGSILAFRCSGINNMNVTSTRFDAGGWSGYLIKDGRRHEFCDWQSFSFRGNTTRLYLSVNRAPWCRN